MADRPLRWSWTRVRRSDCGGVGGLRPGALRCVKARCSKATASCTALDYRHALATPIGLADDIGASIHATIREYVERHPNPTGLVITGRMVRPDGTVPICCAIQSPSFRDRLDPVTRILGADGLLVTTSSGELRAVDDVVSRARSSVDPERRTITTTDVNGDAIRLDVEAFDNHCNLFVTLTPTGACDSAAGSIWPRRHPTAPASTRRCGDAQVHPHEPGLRGRPARRRWGCWRARPSTTPPSGEPNSSLRPKL